MPKHTDPSDSSSGSEEQNPQVSGHVPEYEKHRQAKIAHNKARMEALGLPQMASSLMGSAQNATKKRKGKAKVLEEEEGDDEYRPEEEEGPGSSDNDEDLEDEESPGVRKKKILVKNKGSKPKNTRARSSLRNSDYLDEDEALKQAIALSLQDSAVSGVEKANVNGRKGETQIQQDTGRKRKKLLTSRLQMTEDELVLHFFQFDERCNGGFSARDLERVAIAHDFMWTDKEIADMIHLFDSDGDAKLSLEDFRKIVVRCKLIKAPENS